MSRPIAFQGPKLAPKPSTNIPFAPTRLIPSSVPFPQLLESDHMMKHVHRFVQLLNKLEINIPFVEALKQMPKYVKFMKDILKKKKRLRG